MLDDLERRALKSVVGHAVKLAGGQDNAVNVNSRIGRAAAFSDYANHALTDRHCPIDVAIEIDQFNAEPLILKTMARLGFAGEHPASRTASHAPFHLLEQRMYVDQMLAKITDARKQLTFRLFMDGWSDVSIAETIGKSDKTVRAWIKEGQELLKKEIGERL
jgi:hypothetical protein